MSGFVLAVLLLQADSRDYAGAVDRGVTFPPPAELEEARRKGDAAKTAVDLFTDRGAWARALREVDERTGLFDGTLEVAVRFGDLKGRQAEGGGKGGRGQVTLDLKQLADYVGRIGEFRAAVKAGKTFSVPPARLEGILAHELTHCFQGGAGPAWFQEGMAAYVAQDPHSVYAFRYARQKARDIEEEVKAKHLYARAWAFFEYLRDRHGAEKCRRFIALVSREGKSPPEAAREAMGAEWADLKREELRWSAEWLENRR